MIHVLATIEVHAGRRAAFLDAFAKIVSTVRAEEGCIEYGAAIDLETGLERQAPLRDDAVVIIEKWASLAALEAHLNAPHMAEYRERVKDLVAGATLRILDPVDV